MIEFYTFPKSRQLSKLCTSKIHRDVTTSLESAVFLLLSKVSMRHSTLHFRVVITTAQNTFLLVMYHTPGLACSCCNIMTPQHHRYTGAVESHLNYPRTEYGAPTCSCSCDWTNTKCILRAVVTLILQCLLTINDTEFCAGLCVGPPLLKVVCKRGVYFWELTVDESKKSGKKLGRPWNTYPVNDIRWT